MKHKFADQPSKAPTPWEDEASVLVAHVRERFDCDHVAVAVIQAEQPHADELLLAHGWSEKELADWLSSGFAQDRFLRQTLQQGIEVEAPASQRGGSDSPLTRGLHAMAHAAPEAAIGGAPRRWWWLLLARRSEPFNQAQQQRAALMLRRWQCRFSHVDEPGSSRFILGHDHRLLAADLLTQEQLIDQPGVLAELLRQVAPVVTQRWPNLADGSDCDTVTEIGGRRLWVRLRRSRALPRNDATQWFVRTHELEPDDLPAVGLVDDPRIGLALAHIHDHFDSSPTLAQLAKLVHVSPFHFHRLFSRRVGLSPKQYLQRKQLQVARWLLRNTRKPVNVIARQCGFASHGHFTSTFHRMTGKSPRAYREFE